MNNPKEKATGLRIGLIATRIALLADVIGTPVAVAVSGEAGVCYGGLGALMAIGFIDLALSNRIRKIEGSAEE